MMKIRKLTFADHELGEIVFKGPAQCAEIQGCFFSFLGNVLAYLKNLREPNSTPNPQEFVAPLKAKGSNFIEIPYMGMKLVFWLVVNTDEGGRMFGTVSVARRHPVDNELIEVPAAVFEFDSKGLTNLVDLGNKSLNAQHWPDSIMIFGDALRATLLQPVGAPKRYE
jgi:hypothetical protein